MKVRNNNRAKSEGLADEDKNPFATVNTKVLKSERLAESPLSKIVSPLAGNSIREVTWQLNYDAYRNFLIKKKYIPKVGGSKEEKKLCGWLSHNRDMLRNGRMPKEHTSLFKDLLKLQERLRKEIRANREKEQEKERNEKEKSKDAYWHKRYSDFMNFLKNGEKGIPAGSTEEQLMQWFYQNLRRMKDGLLNEYRQKLFETLLEKKQSVKTLKTSKGKGRVNEVSKAKEESTIIKRSTSKKPFSPEKRISRYADTAKLKGGKRDLLWNAKLYTYMDYIDVYHRRPSNHKAGDVALVNWFTYSWKLMKKGLMKSDRIEKFQQLIDQIEELQQDRTSLNENLAHDGKESVLQKLHDSKKKNTKKKRKARKKKTSPKKTGRWDLAWKMSCQSFEEFLKENKTIPTPKSNVRLYRWFTKQKRLLREGTLSEARQKAFTKLLGKVEKAEKRKKTATAPKKETAYRIKIKVDRSKPVKQDDMWNAKWHAYIDFMARNKRRPSKHKAEDMVLVNWYKHSKKLLNQGRMEADRIEKFQQLIEQIENIKSGRGNVEKPKETTAPKRKKTYRIKIKVDRSKPVKQEDMWNAKWQAYYDYMAKNQRRPSKYKKEDMVLVNWFKHSKKLLNQGRMQADRIEKFNSLINLTKNVQRKNQFGFVDEAPLPEDTKPEKNKEEKKQSNKESALAKKGTIQLYDYQQDMKDKIENAFKSFRSVMVQMPTGTGKTHVIAAVTKSYISKGHRVFIIAHRRELVAQAKNTIKLYIDENDMNKVEVFSVQWLNRHTPEVKSRPSLIIIDEAHHAVAKTYTSIIDTFPKAKILGLTATPCRLNGHPFTDLFDVLLQSHPINWFIAKEYLSLYDYMSVKPNNDDVRIINSLQKRGADGDFSVKEMSEKLDVHPSLERLCDTIMRYAKDKKGIVYAIDIKHAEHIAEIYRKNGIKAIAISSKTPDKDRDDVLERFRKTQTDGSKPLKDDDIQVIVNVSLFDEGFDCPDVEFIQMARPTLSLSKYLQMVGRGLRVYDGKKYCLILDNVGNYRLFGLPSDDRDWEAMFDGSTKGKGDIKNPLFKSMDLREATDNKRTEMVSILTHYEQVKDLEVEFGYTVFKGDDGRYGVRNKNGEEVVPAVYKDIRIYPNAIARISKYVTSHPTWIDVINLVPFRKRPTIIRSGWLELTTDDNIRFYPRVVTHEMNVDSYTNSDVLNVGIEDGLRFKKFYIQPSEPRKLYKYIERLDFVLLFSDEDGNLFMKEEYQLPLKPITREQWQKKKDEAWRDWNYLHKGFADGSIWKEEHSIVDIGFLKFDKYGNYYRIHDDRLVLPSLYRAVAIRVFGKVCFLGKEYIIVEGHSREPFKIIHQYVDGHRFIVRYYTYRTRYNSTYEADLYFDGKGSYKLTNKKWLGYLTRDESKYLGYYYV